LVLGFGKDAVVFRLFTLLFLVSFTPFLKKIKNATEKTNRTKDATTGSTALAGTMSNELRLMQAIQDIFLKNESTIIYGGYALAYASNFSIAPTDIDLFMPHPQKKAFIQRLCDAGFFMRFVLAGDLGYPLPASHFLKHYKYEVLQIIPEHGSVVVKMDMTTYKEGGKDLLNGCEIDSPVNGLILTGDGLGIRASAGSFFHGTVKYRWIEQTLTMAHCKNATVVAWVKNDTPIPIRRFANLISKGFALSIKAQAIDAADFDGHCVVCHEHEPAGSEAQPVVEPFYYTLGGWYKSCRDRTDIPNFSPMVTYTVCECKTKMCSDCVLTSVFRQLAEQDELVHEAIVDLKCCTCSAKVSNWKGVVYECLLRKYVAALERASSLQEPDQATPLETRAE
jgi:hypothetical protein